MRERTGHGRPAAFSVTTGLRGDVVVLRLAGELDLAAAPLLRARLSEAMALITPPHIVIDTEDLLFCDSSGLSVLVGGLRGVRAAGGRLVLSGVRPRFARLLALTGLTREIRAYTTVDEAAEHLAPSREDG
ncbi:hypothetical protein GCM10027187_05070 [Streptosporangium sandarakinum]